MRSDVLTNYLLEDGDEFFFDLLSERF